MPEGCPKTSEELQKNFKFCAQTVPKQYPWTLFENRFSKFCAAQTVSMGKHFFIFVQFVSNTLISEIFSQRGHKLI